MLPDRHSKIPSRATNAYARTMDLKELRTSVDRDEIDTVVVAFADHLGRLMGKRFDAEFFLADALDHGTHACNYLLTVDMEMEVIEGYEYANWERGYGDFHVVPDLDTLCRAAWTDRTALVLCDVLDADETAVPVSPRAMLRAQIARLTATGNAAFAASELEFYLYQDSYRSAHEAGHADLQPAGWYSEDYHLLQGARIESYVGAARRALRQSGIPVENSKGETGVGQHELNIRYADVLTMADRHAVMKHGMKELADTQGVSVTFMAKPHADDAGNSCHIHLSLWDAKAKTNVKVKAAIKAKQTKAVKTAVKAKVATAVKDSRKAVEETAVVAASAKASPKYELDPEIDYRIIFNNISRTDYHYWRIIICCDCYCYRLRNFPTVTICYRVTECVGTIVVYVRYIVNLTRNYGCCSVSWCCH